MTELTQEYLDKKFTQQTKELKAHAEEQTDSLARIIAETVVTPMTQGFNDLERGQEDIKLKLDNVAYRFELKELQRRVELLEKKAGFAK